VGNLIDNKEKEVEMATIKVKAGDKIVIADKVYVADYIAGDTTKYIGKNIGGGYVIVEDDTYYAEYNKWRKYWDNCDAGRV
tara:strand:- start:355 stop:597 length:243 start_codon:yes stop_codon:yes gene_type:complete